MRECRKIRGCVSPADRNSHATSCSDQKRARAARCGCIMQRILVILSVPMPNGVKPSDLINKILLLNHRHWPSCSGGYVVLLIIVCKINKYMYMLNDITDIIFVCRIQILTSVRISIEIHKEVANGRKIYRQVFR